MKPQGTFKPEAIEQLYSAYAEKHGSELCYDVNAQSFSEAYDYMTCERPDGSKYGTGGQCRKGTETSPGSDEKPSKPATPKQIASAEAKLDKLKESLRKAEEKESEYASAVRGAGYGVARGIAQARAQAGPRRMEEKWRDKALQLGTQVREQQKLVNQMKGIKEEAPKSAPAAPKTSADVRRDKLRKLESSINSRAGAIISKHGKDSPQFQKFFSKYAPKLEKIQGELRSTAFGS